MTDPRIEAIAKDASDKYRLLFGGTRDERFTQLFQALLDDGVIALPEQVDEMRDTSYRYARKYGVLRGRINSALIAAEEQQ